MKSSSSNKNTDAATKLWTNDNGNWTIEQRTCNICGKIYKNPSSLGSHKYWSHQSKESMNAHITKDSGSLTGELKIENNENVVDCVTILDTSCNYRYSNFFDLISSY